MRRKIWLQNEGLGNRILGQENKKLQNNFITMYDQDYGAPKEDIIKRLPPLRTYSSRCLCWKPDKLDYLTTGLSFVDLSHVLFQINRPTGD